MMVKNAYIHIPFCRSKCNYCSFVSFPSLELKSDYLIALKKQIIEEYKGEPLETLYFGGGTPSLLSIDEVEAILRLFRLSINAEITFEVNPDSVDFVYLQALRKLGVNRLSIGVQTFDDNILKYIGRRHSSAQAKLALRNAQKAGFDNISLDFIYGLPNQSVLAFINDLNDAGKVDCQHISLYGLKIDEGCYFSKHYPKDLPDIDNQADMYLKAVEVLDKLGFHHYEVSNFAKNDGYFSKHNINYWKANTYYGFGCSASGYGENTRFKNQDNLFEYINKPLVKLEKQVISEEEKLEETIFLGLRLLKGLNIPEINSKFNIDFYKKYSKVINKYSMYFVKTPSSIAFNINGILISNEILPEFIGD